MRTALAETLRSRWFVAGVHAGLWVLLYLAVTGLGGHSLGFRESNSATNSPALLPAATLARLFARDGWPKTLADTNNLNLFITVQPPAPPPPKTRKIELIYLGFYQTAEGPKRTLLKLGENFIGGQVGSNLTANLFAADATIMTLTLTNPAGQTNLLELNAKKEIEVPNP